MNIETSKLKDFESCGHPGCLNHHHPCEGCGRTYGVGPTSIIWAEILNAAYDEYSKQRKELAHEIWASAQLMPEEVIDNGVDRIIEILKREEKK